jgi:protein associated with RNAse G/E
MWNIFFAKYIYFNLRAKFIFVDETFEFLELDLDLNTVSITQWFFIPGNMYY